MTAYFTIREFNQITNYGSRVKSAKDFEFIARQRWHKSTDPLSLLFKLSRKTKSIKKSWIAKNVRGIYKYHRVERLARLKNDTR